MPVATARQAADKFHNAFDRYALDNGDGFRDADWIGAREYRDEGFGVGEDAFLLPTDDREAYIENECGQFDESARYLVACAADFRLAELETEASRLAVVAKTALTLNLSCAA